MTNAEYPQGEVTFLFTDLVGSTQLWERYPEAMHAERIDGYNPLAVADAIERKKKVLAEGRGPVLLDTLTYRFSGHSPSDASSYRDKEEVELWRQQDSLLNYGEYLTENCHAKEDRLAAMREDIIERLAKVLEAAVVGHYSSV